MDAVVSVTNDDETNILVSLLAKSMGVNNTITRISKAGYYPLLSTIGIEKVVSPRVSAVLLHSSGHPAGKRHFGYLHFWRQGEFIEAVALASSTITKGPIKDISFPKGTLLVCITRQEEIIIPSGPEYSTAWRPDYPFCGSGCSKKA